jgi:predicted nucleotidyltransferase
MNIVEKEAAETVYWLELCRDSPLGDQKVLAQLLQEARELLAIFTASCRTAKRRSRIAKVESRIFSSHSTFAIRDSRFETLHFPFKIRNSRSEIPDPPLLTIGLFCAILGRMRLNVAEVPDEKLVELCRRSAVTELSAFGSVLRGDFRPDSDIDLLVVFQTGAQVGMIAYARLQRELTELFGRKVDLVSKKGLKPHIRDEVIASSRLIYAA